MKPVFNLEQEMNSILQSENVKQASVNTKIAATQNEVTLYIHKFAEMALDLENKGMHKTAKTLKKAVKSLIIRSKSNPEAIKIGQLYGII